MEATQERDDAHGRRCGLKKMITVPGESMKNERLIMSDSLTSRETNIIEELAISNAFELAAIFNVLERKGFISKHEVMEEIKRLRKA